MTLFAVYKSSFRDSWMAARKGQPATSGYPFRTLWQPLRKLLTAAALVCMICSPAKAEVMDRVVTSIKPVHSLVSAVMAGVGEPYLMIQGTASPHTFSLRPSDAMRLKNAQVVFLVDRSMEVSLVNSVHTLAENARVVMLSETKGLVLRRLREGGTFEAHSHETDHTQQHHEQEAHPEDDHGTHQGHAHHEGEMHHAGPGTTHGGDRHPVEGAYNMHLWLDPANAAAMAREIVTVLSEADPDNAAIYAANTRTLLHRLDELTAKITTDLVPARDKPFVVLHDAYQYFEDRFGLSAAGSVIVGSEHSPSAQRIRKLRNKVQELGAICVFSEPQFDTRLIKVITESTPARIGVLDPLGVAIKAGPEAYFALLHNLAASFRECLAPANH